MSAPHNHKKGTPVVILPRENGHELVYVGVAFGVFRRTYGGAGEGWSSARELESGNRHPNSSHPDFRLAGRFPDQHGAALENRNQDLDLSRAVGHCYRIVLAVLFPRLAAGPRLPGGSR